MIDIATAAKRPPTPKLPALRTQVLLEAVVDGTPHRLEEQEACYLLTVGGQQHAVDPFHLLHVLRKYAADKATSSVPEGGA